MVLHQLPVQASNFQIHKDYTNMVRLRSYQGRSPDQNFVGSHGHHKYFNFLGVPITICLELTAHSLIQFGSPVPRHIIYAKLSRNMAFDPGVCSIRNPLHPWKIWLEALIKIWYQ